MGKLGVLQETTTCLHLAVATVDDIQDAINREGCFGYVGGYNALPRPFRRGVEDLGLQI